ncbi:S24 family peptidase [Deinococcus hohokamensis]|uniref:S24 family peptidase n=1 Tax=Deinococcus hohokamensis TaxID=309883 RepID=A0ABV9I441_9DEIO
MTASLFLPQSSVRNIRTLEIYGVVQASEPLAPVDSDDFDYDREFQVLLRGTQYYPGAQAYQVVGNSMSGLIEHGEIALVNPHDAYNQHRPCIFETPNGYVVKFRGLDEKGRPALLSRNPDQGPIRDRGEFIPRGCVYAVYERAFRIRRLL